MFRKRHHAFFAVQLSWVSSTGPTRRSGPSSRRSMP
jgi:hypothetical protein